MDDKEKYQEIVEAVGPERAEQLIVQSLGTIQSAYDYLVEEGMIGG